MHNIKVSSLGSDITIPERSRLTLEEKVGIRPPLRIVNQMFQCGVIECGTDIRRCRSFNVSRMHALFGLLVVQESTGLIVVGRHVTRYLMLIPDAGEGRGFVAPGGKELENLRFDDVGRSKGALVRGLPYLYDWALLRAIDVIGGASGR